MPESREPFQRDALNASHQFLTTHWSVVVSAGQDQTDASFAALEQLCRAYWYPIFAYVRRKGYNVEPAKDLTQAFFAQVIGRKYMADANPERGRFRTFLLTSLNHFLANEWDRGQTQRRGGGVEFISLDFAQEQESRGTDPGHEWSPDRIYERRWAEAVLGRVLEALRREFDGSQVKRFDVLKRFLTEAKGETSYVEAAKELGMSEQAVKSAIHRLRQRWRERMREEIAQTLNATTGSNVDEEIRYLIGVLG